MNQYPAQKPRQKTTRDHSSERLLKSTSQGVIKENVQLNGSLLEYGKIHNKEMEEKRNLPTAGYLCCSKKGTSEEDPKDPQDFCEGVTSFCT